jgi:CheY-like chemotaxis protein
MKSGPIVLVEDDRDDQELIIEALKGLSIPNEIQVFENGAKALEFLFNTNEQPFLIVSDVNMPSMDGLMFRAEILKSDYLRGKDIPFVFLSTTANNLFVRKAHDLNVPGYFQKPSKFQDLQELLSNIFYYWLKARRSTNLS